MVAAIGLLTTAAVTATVVASHSNKKTPQTTVKKQHVHHCTHMNCFSCY
jgi:hypothetical protein